MVLFIKYSNNTRTINRYSCSRIYKYHALVFFGIIAQYITHFITIDNKPIYLRLIELMYTVMDLQCALD